MDPAEKLHYNPVLCLPLYGYQNTIRIMAHRVPGYKGTLVAGFIAAGGEIFQKYQHEPIKMAVLTVRTIPDY